MNSFRTESDLDYLQVESEPPNRLVIIGELDRDTVPVLQEALAGLFDLTRKDCGAELDLSGLTFVDAAGVRCLMRCQLAAEQAGTTLTFLRPTSRVSQVLAMLGVKDLLNVR
ncbi:STAS domain-containing protein [Catenuloplanes atrovinosus]|uniref:Anti-sigma B factor antagonist n=1 Tax=Catenuloplanes atrovinosus TaxID=137266 RepID=A0AAE3YKL0_9ACTN|nr:STAS domain-containing protein [Catenuloplanes atrovinosus]MDR7275180.1 anti-sigma B factor antagonist [Catenuloplanes atrovinosus]